MEVIPKRKFQCLDCGYEFEEPFGKPRWMIKCHKCRSENIVRVDGPQGYGRGYCRGYGRGGRGWGRGRGCGRGWRFGFGWGRRG